MELVKWFIVAVLVVILLLHWRNKVREVDMVKSSINKHSYLVRNLKDKQQAADILAEISRRARLLVDHLHKAYPKNPNAAYLQKTFDPFNISEGAPKKDYTTYTIDKSQIVFCLRRKDGTDKLQDLDTVIMYVFLHELTHSYLKMGLVDRVQKDFMNNGSPGEVSNERNGHGEIFNRNFPFILTEAAKLGLYKPVDFSKKPARYCGMTITDPLLVK